MGGCALACAIGLDQMWRLNTKHALSKKKNRCWCTCRRYIGTKHCCSTLPRFDRWLKFWLWLGFFVPCALSLSGRDQVFDHAVYHEKGSRGTKLRAGCAATPYPCRVFLTYTVHTSNVIQMLFIDAVCLFCPFSIPNTRSEKKIGRAMQASNPLIDKEGSHFTLGETLVSCTTVL